MFKALKSCWKTLLVTATLLVGSAFGQAAYTTTGGYRLVDNRATCASHQCFVPADYTASGETAKLTSISSGGDYILGVDAAGSIWTLATFPASGARSLWTSALQNTPTGLTGRTGVVLSVAVRNSTEIYALAPTAVCTGQNAKGQIFQWVSTANPPQWIPHSGCLDKFFVSQDDLMVGTQNGNLWYSADPTDGTAATWTKFPTGSGWTSAVSYAGQIFAMQGEVMYVLNLSSGTYQPMGGGQGPSLIVTSDGTGLAIGLDGYLYTMDVKATTPVWTKQAGTYLGTTASLYGGDTGTVFSINSSSVPSHYLAIAMSAYVSISGNYNCALFGGTCPPNSMHTATAHVAFPHGLGNGIAKSVGPPATYLYATAEDSSLLCDPMFGQWNAPECVVSTGSNTSNVSCSVMGIIGNFVANLPTWKVEKEIAYTKYLNLGAKPGTECYVSEYGNITCTFIVTPICSNTANPDYKYLSGTFGDPWVRDYYYPAWRSVGVCARLVFNTGHTGWLCTQASSLLTVGTGDLTDGVCTYNP
jgi:hypothetical protein